MAPNAQTHCHPVTPCQCDRVKAKRDNKTKPQSRAHAHTLTHVLTPISRFAKQPCKPWLFGSPFEKSMTVAWSHTLYRCRRIYLCFLTGHGRTRIRAVPCCGHATPSSWLSNVVSAHLYNQFTFTKTKVLVVLCCKSYSCARCLGSQGRLQSLVSLCHVIMHSDGDEVL